MYGRVYRVEEQEMPVFFHRRRSSAENDHYRVDLHKCVHTGENVKYNVSGEQRGSRHESFGETETLPGTHYEIFSDNSPDQRNFHLQ